MANSLQRPSTTLNIVGGVTKAQNDNHRVLIIAEIGDTSTVTVDEVIKDIQVSNISQFGNDSQLYYAIEKFKKINEVSVLDVLPIDKGSSQSTADITITDNATNNSKLIVSIGGGLVYKEVNITAGDSNIGIATALETTFAGDKLFTVSRVGEVVTITSIQGSASLNGVRVFIDDTSNSGCNIVATPLSGGASTTLADTFLDNILDERYNSIIFDYANGANASYKYLDNNFNLTNSIKDGVSFTTINKSLSASKSLGANYNSKSLVIFANLDEMNFNTFPLVLSSEIVAIRALRLTDKANISRFVMQGSVETKGGMSLASLPYFNTPIGIDKPIGLITESELISLTDSGISTLTNNGTTVLSEVVTTYKTDNTGTPDISWKYLNYVDTMSTIREYLVSNLRKKYAQTRLTDGNIIAGKAIANKGMVKATFIKLYNDLAKMALTRLGVDKFVNENLTIEDDLTTGTITINAKLPIVTQLRTIDGNVIEVLDFSSTL